MNNTKNKKILVKIFKIFIIKFHLDLIPLKNKLNIRFRLYIYIITSINYSLILLLLLSIIYFLLYIIIIIIIK